MAGISYFLPLDASETKLNLEILRRFDLVDVFGLDCTYGADYTSQFVAQGPGRTPGVYIYCMKPRADLPKGIGFYDYDRQTWFKFRNYWVGCQTVSPPQPEDLERSETFFSGTLEDPNGGKWKVAVIKSPDPAGGSLPKAYSWDEHGNMVHEIQMRYRGLWELAGQVWEDIRSEEMSQSEEWYVRAALSFLQLNYRVGEAAMMLFSKLGREVLVGRVPSIICMHAIEWDILEKKNPESQPTESTIEMSNTSLGLKEDSQVIAQAVAHLKDSSET